jgi:hypothetical protein
LSSLRGEGLAGTPGAGEHEMSGSSLQKRDSRLAMTRDAEGLDWQ